MRHRVYKVCSRKILLYLCCSFWYEALCNPGFNVSKGSDLLTGYTSVFLQDLGKKVLGLEWILIFRSLLLKHSYALHFHYDPVGTLRSLALFGFYEFMLPTKVFCHGGTVLFDFNSLKSKQEIRQLNRLSNRSDFSALCCAAKKKKKTLQKQTAEGRFIPSPQRPSWNLFMCVTEEMEKRRQGDGEITEQAKWK